MHHSLNAKLHCLTNTPMGLPEDGADERQYGSEY